MKISIRFFGYLREAIGFRQVDIEVDEKTTIGNLPEILVLTYGNSVADHIYGSEESFDNLRVLINGQDHTVLEGLDTKLNEGDMITLLPPLSGGSGGTRDSN